MFKDRASAGKLLAAELSKYKGQSEVVLAVPRGGIPVAYPIAKELGLPLNIVFTKKIGHPANKEYAIGAASLTDYFVIPQLDVTQDYIQKELKHIRNRLKTMRQKFMGDQKDCTISGKTVIIVDDGVATGNTLLSTVGVIKKGNPSHIVVAVPVASKEAMERLQKEADEVITLLIPESFYGVGAFYKNFNDVTDEEVIFYLNKMNNLRQQSKPIL